MILQLIPQIEMQTSKGRGFANFLVDRGMDFDNEWIVFLDSGEIWSFLNKDVRIPKNVTYGRDGGDKEESESPKPKEEKVYTATCEKCADDFDYTRWTFTGYECPRCVAK